MLPCYAMLHLHTLLTSRFYTNNVSNINVIFNGNIPCDFHCVLAIRNPSLIEERSPLHQNILLTVRYIVKSTSVDFNWNFISVLFVRFPGLFACTHVRAWPQTYYSWEFLHLVFYGWSKKARR